MAAANATTTIKSVMYHPENPLKTYHYGEGSTYSCNYDVHPRCRSRAAAAQPPPQAQGGRRRRGKALRSIKNAFKIFIFGVKVADFFTGGIMSPALDALEIMVD
ncbi:unnamed protein product [Urochloa humidicola]